MNSIQIPAARYLRLTIIASVALISVTMAQTTQTQKGDSDTKSVQKRTSFPNGFRVFDKNTHHYFLVATPATLGEAKKHAEKEGGHLVTINDETEKSNVTAITREAMRNQKLKEPGWIWVGASKEDGQWVWDDGTKFTPVFLKAPTLGKQKNKLTTTPLNQNCLVLRTDKGLSPVDGTGVCWYVIEWNY